jgi:hypothetical protein
MKMDAGADVLRAQALLLKLFMLIGGAKCSEYINALSASLLLWGQYEQCNHPCWQLFQHNANAFNEESGEISLSVLARDISRGGVRSDCKKVAQTFKLVKAKAEVAEDFGIDLAGDDFGSDNNGRCIKTDSSEVKTTTAYLRTVIRHILSETYRHYDKDCGHLAKGVRTARPTVGMQAFTACFRSVLPAVDAAVAKLKKSTVGFWVAAHADIWPAAIPSIDFGSDQSDVEIDDLRQAGSGKVADKHKRKEKSEGSEASSGAKKAKNASNDELVGCVVAVPVWKFGAAWAGRNFQRTMTAVLIGDVVALDPKRSKGPFSVAMRGEKGHILLLKRSEVVEFRLEGAAAAAAEDSPWKNGVEVD